MFVGLETCETGLPSRQGSRLADYEVIICHSLTAKAHQGHRIADIRVGDEEVVALGGDGQFVEEETAILKGKPIDTDFEVVHTVITAAET